MRCASLSVHVAALLGIVPTVLGCYNGDLAGSDVSCRHEALEYIACQEDIPIKCIPKIVCQAVELCSSCLAVTTTTVVTASRVTTVTITETQTSTATDTDTSTSTAETTSTEVSEATVTSTTGTTTVTSVVPPALTVTVAPRDAAHPKCPSLDKTRFCQLSPEKLSSVCKCLGVTATTVVATETTTASSTTTDSATSTLTVTTTTTTVVVVSSTTTTTTTSTTTTDTEATQTVVVDACNVSYNPSGDGTGDTILTPGGINSARECCLLCWNTLNCVASAFPNQCQLLVKTQPLAGAPTSPTCPLGIEHYNFLPGPGVVFQGPCAFTPPNP